MVDGSGDCGLGDVENVGKEVFSEVVPQVQEGDFEGLVEAEGSWSGGWFIPVEGLFEGFDERGELVAGEPGCTMVLQRSFPVVVRLFLAI